MKKLNSTKKGLCSLFLIVFSIIVSISSIVNATESNLSLEWSDYVWEAYTKSGKIIKTYHQNHLNQEYLVYCYQEGKESPPMMFSTKYRKTTVNNKTLPLLYEHIPSINKPWWEETPETTLPKVLMAISRGYPSNKETLQEKFGNDEGTLYRGTQFAIWAITGQYDKDNGWKNVEKEPQAAKVTKYILGVDPNDATYKIGAMYEDIPNVLPNNTQVSYFEPKDSMYQTLLALENIEDPEKVHPKISVSKVWDNISQADVVNNIEINVAVKRDNNLITYLNLNADNNWYASYIDEVNAGTNPSYSVVELDSNGNEVTDKVSFDSKTYSVDINCDESNNFIVKNTYIPQSNIPLPDTISIDGSKIWDDDDNRDNKRPDSITIRLYANGEEKEVKQVTKEDNWKWIFENLPKYENGKEVTYTIKEDVVENYTSDIDGYDVTNHYTPGKTSVNVTKAWDDKNNQDGNRPKSITIKLLADGVETEKSVELNEENGWTSTFEGLDEYKEGQKINYTVKEESIEGYISQISGNMTKGYIITNSYTPKVISLSGSKIWDDDDNRDNKRPDSITIRLYANGEEKEVKQVTKEDNWKWSFTDLPQYKNGKEVTYTIKEDAVENYTSDIDGYDVTNHYTPGKTSVNVTKAWDDKNNQDGNRPKSITINLLADGVETGKSLVLSEENSWTSSFEELNEYKQGQKINYTVKEEAVEGYVSQISGNMTKGYVITNKVVLKDQKMGETEPKNKDNNKENSNKKKVVTPNTIDESNVIIPSLLFVLSLFSLIYLKIRYIK